MIYTVTISREDGLEHSVQLTDELINSSNLNLIAYHANRLYHAMKDVPECLPLVLNTLTFEEDVKAKQEFIAAYRMEQHRLNEKLKGWVEDGNNSETD